ncbi:MAG: N-acetylmuramoyl-L-alanine amidase [Bacteroidota bacterium]
MKNSVKILLVALAFVSLSFVNFEKRTINVVIDAGHGGHDLGAERNIVSEKLLVETITKKIQSLNKDTNVKIHLTRSDDSFLGLAERAKFINDIKPDLAISLHVNNNKNTTTNGFEVFISDKTTTYEKSNELAVKFANNYSEKTKLINRGVKTAPFMVLKKSEYPTLLVELGFLSNENDRNYLTSNAGQDEIAQTILDFVSDLKE